MLDAIKDYMERRFILNATEFPYEYELPEVYNKDGERMYFVFLRDTSFGRAPYYFSHRGTKRFLFDRYNPALEYHLYTHEQIFHVVGNPKKKFALLIEGENILPQLYQRVLESRDLMESFDIIFTNQKIILDNFDNARFVPGFEPWYDSNNGGNGVPDIERFKNKNKSISLVSSAKNMCQLHKLRLDIAYYYENKDEVDTFGTFHGGQECLAVDYLDDYRYHIDVENQLTDGFFTQKILDCFLSMTVPIYIGAPDIGKFFNMDGIIIPEEPTLEAVIEAIKICSEEDYLSRVEAMKDNFNRVQDYLSMETYIEKNYKDIFI